MPLARPLVFIPQTLTPSEPVLLTMRGGLRNNIPDEDITDDECSDLSNFIPDLALSGLIIKRAGTTIVSSVQTTAINSIKQGLYATYFTDATKIYTANGTARDTGLTTSTDPDWCVYGGTGGGDIFCNGTEVRVSTNGTSFGALGGSPPAFKYIEAHNNFLWGAGHSAGILRWADIGTANAWTSTNALTLTNNENDNIIGLKKFNSVLKVFCKNSFYDVSGTGPNDIAVLRAYYGTGCTSHRSIVAAPGFLAWWCNLGLAFSRTGTLDDVIFPFMEKIPGTLSTLNQNYYNLVHCVWDEVQRCIQCFVFDGTGQATVNKRIDYYYDEDGGQNPRGQQLGTCWVHNDAGINMGASARVLLSTGPAIYVGSAVGSGSYLYVEDPTVAADNGAAISAYVETRRTCTKSGPDSIKRHKETLVRAVAAGSGTIVIGVYLDDSTSINFTRNLTITASGNFVLDVSALDVGTLGSGAAAVDLPVAWAQRYRKMKYRYSDAIAVRTRLRGILHKGSLLAA